MVTSCLIAQRVQSRLARRSGTKEYHAPSNALLPFYAVDHQKSNVSLLPVPAPFYYYAISRQVCGMQHPRSPVHTSHTRTSRELLAPHQVFTFHSLFLLGCLWALSSLMVTLCIFMAPRSCISGNDCINRSGGTGPTNQRLSRRKTRVGRERLIAATCRGSRRSCRRRCPRPCRLAATGAGRRPG